MVPKIRNKSYIQKEDISQTSGVIDVSSTNGEMGINRKKP